MHSRQRSALLLTPDPVLRVHGETLMMQLCYCYLAWNSVPVLNVHLKSIQGRFILL
jgi:hypothetical protein